MNTPPAPGHDQWEELAAGYALHALEPDEESTFESHLDGCDRCRAVLDDHAFVAAQLGALADDAALTTPSWSSIRAGVVPTDPMSAATDPGPDPVISLDAQRTRRRPTRLLAAAAAAVVVAGVGTTVWQFSGGSTTTGTSAVARCQTTPACHVVHLDGTAVVLATGNQARMVPTSLPAPATGRVYALWQLPRDGRPSLVALMPSLPSPNQASPSVTLHLPYADTAAFAISDEPAGVTPTHPTEVVATGTALA